ncbi:MAG: NADH-quinone oxidoreductase subunit NuoF [Deltaproteobacteria bacterium]|jgi:NADH-quinone oxidoreductase subunit F|nr:NADH-quinone oxidoreductase subunit NuoF [Deltaproteobacteria bacterium]MBW2318239.1 NADH-quinone oxidoreductase subunit NuoF [Deltaproteobacteria bacterium]
MANKILICMGTSGISAGAFEVAKAFEKQLKKEGLAGAYEVVRVGDRGLFRDVLVDVIPADGKRITYEYIKVGDVSTIVKEHLKEGIPVEKLLAGKDYERFFEGQMRLVLANCGEIDPENIDEYISAGGYEALPKALKMTRDEVIEEIKSSGLGGRGGAGFSTGLKWRFAKDAPGNVKYMICNADEGDPGAFMDRSVLEGDPHAVLEGMAIGAYAIGSSEGFIYCRAEYPLAIKRLAIAIDQAKQKGLLGKDILGSHFSFNVSIVQGAGAFVCGEETALMASIEGERGMPRVRPPFPAQKGLYGAPTNINNVETLANIRHIVTRGAGWYAAIGTENSKGTKVFALAGKVKNTGLVEVPMGTTIHDLIFGPGGGPLNKRAGVKAVQMGGPSGGCIPAELHDLPIDYQSINKTGAIMGSGGIIVVDAKTCMVDVARYFLNFTVEESCGKCVPCRIGLKRLHEVLTKITEGNGTPELIEFLGKMSETIKNTSLCGLGNTAPNPVLTTLRYFRDEYDAHVKDRVCPAHVCTALLDFEVDEEKCSKCGRCFKVCPAGAISWKKKEYARIDKDKCTKCKSCILTCEFMAIR